MHVGMYVHRQTAKHVWHTDILSQLMFTSSSIGVSYVRSSLYLHRAMPYIRAKTYDNQTCRHTGSSI
jgi:hypothetical protein